MIIVYIIILLIGLIVLGCTFHAIFRFGYKKGGADLFSLFAKGAFEQKVNMFRTLINIAKPGGIVFVGDSITQDYPVHELFHGKHVYNRGIGGDQTVGVKSRLYESVYGLKPRLVFLLIGTNDLVNENRLSNHDIAENILSIYKDILEHHIRCKVISILPVNPTMDSYTVSSRTNRDIDAINAEVKNHLNQDFVDISDAFKDKQGNLEKNYSIEGLHLTYQGYKHLTAVLKPYME